MSRKYKKRLLIFFFVPLLVAVQFVTEDAILQIAAAVLEVIYVGFIIFLRDTSSRDENQQDDEYEESEEQISDSDGKKGYETDSGEEFTIVSANKDVELITEDTYTPMTTGGRKTIFKPPDLKENFDKIATEKLPRDIGHDKQFVFILERILHVVKDAFLAHSALYFWYNKNKNKLTLEKFVSASGEIVQRRFEIENDILSKIVEKEEPELLTDINQNAEADVIRYYNNPQGVKSFVGVPLFYGDELTAILALDSKENDAFGIETIYSLGRIVRIISIIISLYEEKYADTLAEQRLKTLLNILKNERKFESEGELFAVIEKSLSELISWDAFAFVYYNPESKRFITSKVVNNTRLKYIGENLEIELNGTLVGKAIVSGLPVKIDDITKGNYLRYSKAEDITLDGAFLALPLVYNDTNYGVICLENLKKGAYANADVNFLKNSLRIFSFIVYSFSSQNMLKGLLARDIETRALNSSNFIEQLGTELIRAAELELPSTLALIKIDDFLEEETLFEGNPFPKVLKSITDSIREEMNPFGIFGRLGERIFAVYFFNASSKDIFLWAEKLRIKIARKPIAVISKQTTFTVSIGIASANNRTAIEEVMSDAELALEKALEKTNTVKSAN